MTEPALLAFRAAPEALLVADAAGVVRLVSVQAERLLRRGAAELVGRRLDELLVGDPTGNAAGPGAAEPGGEAGREPIVTTSALRLPGGRQVPVDVRISPLAETGGEADPAVRGWLVLSIADQGQPARSRAALEQDVRQLNAAEMEQARLLSDLIRAQERERARIAAGVHDDTLQVITGAMLRLQQLRRRLRDPGALEVLARLEESIALAADRLRRLIFDFRPPALERSGLAAAVRDLLSRLADDTGLEVRLYNRLGAEPALPTRLLLYRILQEALVNVGRHADAAVVEVTIADQAGGYLVRVADDGVGMPASTSTTTPAPDAKPGHLGVILMRERAEFSGGWFRLDSAVGLGTTVSVWVPHGADLENRPRPPALRPASGSPQIQALWDAWQELCGDEEGEDRG
jgi:signal transduction histidine kinase